MLQAAVNSAEGNDVIELSPAGTYQGPIFLPNRGNLQPITIRTRGYGGPAWPAAGQWVAPGHAGLMARLLTSAAGPGIWEGAIMTRPSCKNWTLQGLYLQAQNATGWDGSYIGGMLCLWDYDDAPPPDGRGTGWDASHLPSGFRIQHCLIRGATGGATWQGIRVWANDVTIDGTYIDRLASMNQDTNCIEHLKGSGLVVTNSFLGDGTENYMAGGGDIPFESQIPSNIVFRRCYFTKPSSRYRASPDWDGVTSANGAPYNVKNLFELKMAKNVLVEGCTFDTFYGCAQRVPIVITTTNQSGGNPWSTIQNVVFQNNVVKHVPGVLLIHGKYWNQCVKGSGLVFRNNLCYDISYERYHGPHSGLYLLEMMAMDNVHIEHNTFWGTSLKAPFSVGGALLSSGFIYRDNICWSGGEYPGQHPVPSDGIPAPYTMWNGPLCSDVIGGKQDWIVTNNVAAGASQITEVTNYRWPGPPEVYRNIGSVQGFTPAVMEGEHFVNARGNDYRLRTGSTLLSFAHDSSEVGADIEAILRAGAVV